MPLERQRLGTAMLTPTPEKGNTWYAVGVATGSQIKPSRKAAEHSLVPTGGDLGFFVGSFD